jgi:hypothetical protein
MDLLNVFYINALEKLYQERKVTESEVKKLQTYLCEKFGSDNFHLVERVRAEDSLEVYLGEEFMGTLYRDEDDGDISYDFNMAILEIDLPK